MPLSGAGFVTWPGATPRAHATTGPDDARTMSPKECSERRGGPASPSMRAMSISTASRAIAATGWASDVMDGLTNSAQ